MYEDNIVQSVESNPDYNNLNKEKFIFQNNYKEEMLEKVEPYLKKNLMSGYILGKNNTKLYYEKFIVENPRANIIICHGFGEFTEKYYELIYYFLQKEYSVFIVEHRGHGRSQRLGIDDSQINVENFNYYVEDFKKFIDEIVILESSNKNLLLFAHSMGGAIGTIFLEEYPMYFTAAILNSPMHEINTGKIPRFLANFVSRSLIFLGKELNYLPGQGPYLGKISFPNRSTSCKERYEYIKEKIEKNKIYQNGGSSARWYFEALKATKKFMKEEYASKIKIPLLLIQAEYDTHVMPKAQSKFASYVDKCKLIFLKGAKHESYYERDEILFCFLNKVLWFYDKNV